MSELTTVPTFTYRQGQLGDDDFETQIRVEYYNGTITLRQDGGYKEEERINISPKHLEKLFKEIKKNLPAANNWLEKHNK